MSNVVSNQTLFLLEHYSFKFHFQVFIGHSEVISKIQFTADETGLISVGEALFVWRFNGNKRNGVHKFRCGVQCFRLMSFCAI